MENVWNAINEIKSRINSLFHYIKKKDKNDIRERLKRYQMYMNSDIGYLNLGDKATDIWKVELNLCEIDAFIEFQLKGKQEFKEEYEQMCSAFSEVNDKYYWVYYDRYKDYPINSSFWKEKY